MPRQKGKRKSERASMGTEDKKMEHQPPLTLQFDNFSELSNKL